MLTRSKFIIVIFRWDKCYFNSFSGLTPIMVNINKYKQKLLEVLKFLRMKRSL